MKVYQISYDPLFAPGQQYHPIFDEIKKMGAPLALHALRRGS